jgi:hypothetical protein
MGLQKLLIKVNYTIDYPMIICKKTCFIIFVLTPLFVFSQTITGTVNNTQGESLIQIALLIKTTNQPDVISEFFNSKNGKFEIVLSKEYQDILVEAKVKNYLTESFTIKNSKKNKIYNINFVLKKIKIIQLEEVIISAKKRPFKIKKDTISYNIDSYLDGSERKVQDLIKKLPGIELNTNTGEIKYKGKSIETVLLEGDNLFDYNYSLGTKNINIDIVEQVQVIENYSENPHLKGIENGNKVALNLKLKKGKIDFSGNIDLGTGFFEDKDQALNFNSNILGITKNYKSFATLSYNNIGINNTPFDYFGFNLNAEELKEKDFFAQKIIQEKRFSNTLDDKRVNINNQYFGNYNAIFKINKRLKVKTNLYYINDNITSNQLFENQNIINNRVFTTKDDLVIARTPIQYRSDLGIKYNISKASLLEYNLSVRDEEIKTHSSIVSNNENSFNSLLDSKDFYLSQKLLFTEKLSDNKAFQFILTNSTNKIPQTYEIGPSIIDSDDHITDIQKTEFTKKYFEAKATLLGSSKNGNKYTFSLGGILDDNKLKSELFSKNLAENITAENGVNNLEYSKKKAYNLGAYHFNHGKLKISSSYALSLVNQNINSIENNIVNTKSNFIIEPSLKIKYRLNSISFITANARYNKSPNVENYLFLNEIRVNNRTTISNIPSLKLQESINYSMFYFNNDLYRLLEINLGVTYIKSKGNFFSDFNITENNTQIEYFFLPQINENILVNFLISKYIPFLNTNIEFSSNYSFLKYKNLINDSVLRNNQTQNFKNELFLKTAFNGSINFENIINITKSISKSQNSNQFINESLNNTFKIILKPSKKWFILLSSDYFIPSKSQKLENYMFLDAIIRFKPKNKKLEFNFTLKNLLNENNFEQIQTSDFSINIHRTNILPRYYLLNMSYNF